MESIDWRALGLQIVSVFGLGVSLAALSHMRWAAKHAGVPLRNAIGKDAFLAPFFAGLFLFAGGEALNVGHLSQTVAWAVLALLFAYQAAIALRTDRRARRTPDCVAGEDNLHEASQ